MKPISTPAAPAARGDYSQAIVHGGLVYISDIAQWPAFNAVYAEMIGPHRPARTVVPVAQLHYGYLLEMDAIAAV